MQRKDGPVRELPAGALEGIARMSGMFDVSDGEISRKQELDWCVIGRRDLVLLEVCAEHGRVVSSSELYGGLVRSGLTQENAAAVVGFSPFLVHTRSGLGTKEGVYRFVVKPEDLDLDALKERVQGGSGGQGS